MPTTEQTLFSEKAIFVTTHRVMLPPQMPALGVVPQTACVYAAGHIAGYRYWTARMSVLVPLLGVLLLLPGLVMLTTNEQGLAILVCLPGALLLAIYFLVKPKHWLRILSTSGDAYTFHDTDDQHIARLIEALQQVMLSR